VTTKPEYTHDWFRTRNGRGWSSKKIPCRVLKRTPHKTHIAALSEDGTEKTFVVASESIQERRTLGEET
jgi:hypothetical protein